MKYQCPSCGADVTFRSKSTVSITCNYCRSLLVRHDANLELIGKVADLFDDVTPLMVRTVGRAPEGSFTLLGRVRWRWSDGAWNEWFMDFNNGKSGWLAEAQGTLSVCVEANEGKLKIPPLIELKAGKTIQLSGRAYTVDDIKSAEAFALEGEMPFVVKPGTKKVAVDLSDEEGNYACLEYAADGGSRLYLGKHYDQADLKLANLKRVDLNERGGGAAAPAKAKGIKAFQCPSCAAPIQLRVQESLAAACGNCAAVIDVKDPSLALLSEASKAKRYTPLIPLGAVGKLGGEEYTLIGYMRRCDGTELHEWEEYLLYNPSKGFRWLMQFRGHWNFIRTTKQKPRVSGKRAEYLGKSYALYMKDSAKVVYVEGEFYWRVKYGEKVKVQDFVRPPGILSKEEGDGEIVWSSGEYTEPELIRAAFGVKDSFPARQGVAPNQPSPASKSGGRFFLRACALMAALTVVQCAGYIRSKNLTVFKGDYDPTVLTPGDGVFGTLKGLNGKPVEVYKTEEFDVEQSISNLEVESAANVDNQWMELGITLVNAKTDESLNFEQGIEYYHGYDSDGSWSEGDREASTLLSAVPGGRYYMLIEPFRGPGATLKPFTVSVRRDVPSVATYFWFLSFLMIAPLFGAIRHYMHEVSRWSDSDYSPYQS